MKAQSAFTQVQGKIMELMAEATQNTARMDQSVTTVNDMKAEIIVKMQEVDAKTAALEQRILEHETAILTSGQASGLGHDRLTAPEAELDL